MPSLLTNHKMPATLRARVEASLKSDALARVGGANRRQGNVLFRVLLLSGLCAFGVFLVLSFRQAEREFVAEKTALIERYRAQSTPIDQAFEKRLAIVDHVLSGALEPYAGDIGSAELESPLRLEDLLAKPLLYIRGPQRGFRTDAERREQAEQAGPDALPRCLMIPPPNDEETTLLRHLGRVYQPKVLSGRFVSLTRAYRAVDFLHSSFKKRLDGADTARSLPYLEAELRAAELPLAVGLREASYFFYVLDEPKVPGTVADFDGEAEHHIRMGLVALDGGATIFRLRRLVNPEWISEKSRLAYSRELNSCRLAWQIRK